MLSKNNLKQCLIIFLIIQSALSQLNETMPQECDFHFLKESIKNQTHAVAISSLKGGGLGLVAGAGIGGVAGIILPGFGAIMGSAIGFVLGAVYTGIYAAGCIIKWR